LAICYFAPLLVMILIDFFTEACCKGTELIEGWYWYEDDGDNVGGPFEDEEDAILAAKSGIDWSNARQ
jgi:hypothetical protein